MKYRFTKKQKRLLIRIIVSAAVFAVGIGSLFLFPSFPWIGRGILIASYLVAGYDGREREFGLALASDGQPLVYQWMGGLANARLDTAPVRITRDGDTTRYRAALPWSAMLLKPPRPGETITFSFTVNDNDSDHLRGWLEWSSGVCGGKDSSRFGELHFAE